MADGSAIASGGRKLAASSLDPKWSGKVDDPGRAGVLEGCAGGAAIAKGGAAAMDGAGGDGAADADAAEAPSIGLGAPATLGAAARFCTRSSKLRSTETLRS